MGVASNNWFDRVLLSFISCWVSKCGRILSNGAGRVQDRRCVFRGVVFQDVGFEHNGFKPLTHMSFRCEVPTPSVVEGQQYIGFKPHILKHHIPELPTDAQPDGLAVASALRQPYGLL